MGTPPSRRAISVCNKLSQAQATLNQPRVKKARLASGQAQSIGSKSQLNSSQKLSQIRVKSSVKLGSKSQSNWGQKLSQTRGSKVQSTLGQKISQTRVKGSVKLGSKSSAQSNPGRKLGQTRVKGSVTRVKSSAQQILDESSVKLGSTVQSTSGQKHCQILGKRSVNLGSKAQSVKIWAKAQSLSVKSSKAPSNKLSQTLGQKLSSSLVKSSVKLGSNSGQKLSQTLKSWILCVENEPKTIVGKSKIGLSFWTSNRGNLSQIENLWLNRDETSSFWCSRLVEPFENLKAGDQM